MHPTQQPSTTPRYTARPCTSLGDDESLAGIEQRSTFWAQFRHLHTAPVQQYIDAGLAELDRIIDRRVATGEVSLVCDRTFDRRARNKRIRTGAYGERAAP